MKIRERLTLSISIIVFILFSLSIPYLSYTGAFTFDETLTESLNANFTENGIIKLTFADNVTAFKLSGQVEGAGAAYLKTENARLLVFNSTGSKFLNACEETCNFNGGKTAELEVIVTEGIITLTSISYDIKIVDEPPVWEGRTNFTLKLDEPVIINLDNFFSDPEGVNLTYLVFLYKLFNRTPLLACFWLSTHKYFKEYHPLINWGPYETRTKYCSSV